MTWRNLMYDLMSSDEDNEYHTEDILNVFRRSDDAILGSAEVADEVGMTTDGATNRLKQLMEDGRVEGKQIGRPWVWTLPNNERQKVVPSNIDRLIYVLEWFDNKARLVLVTGLLAAIIGLSFLYWGVTEAFLVDPVSGISPDVIMAIGWSFAGAGGLLSILTGATVLMLRGIERMAIKRATISPMNGSSEKSRGQVSPQFLLGLLVILILAGPLINAAINIQQNLAISSLFNSEQATIFALLIIVLIVASIFQNGQ